MLQPCYNFQSVLTVAGATAAHLFRDTVVSRFFLFFLHVVQVKFCDVWRSIGADVKSPVIFVDFTHVGRHHAVRIMKASGADTAFVDFCHQTVAGDKLA